MYKWMRMETWTAHHFAATRDPRKHPYGLLGGNISPGGVQKFIWFETPEEMLFFITKKLLPGFFHLRGLDSDEYHSLRELRNAALKIQEQFLGGEISFQEAGKSLQHILAAVDFEASWWGLSSELFQGQDEFSRGLRSGFREEYLDPDTASEEEYEIPIKPEEGDKFCELIREYEG